MTFHESLLVKKAIADALLEDIGNGDHTTFACIPENKDGSAKLLVKQNGVIAGIDIARIVFEAIDPSMSFITYCKDGQQVLTGTVAFEVHGSVRHLLTAERLVLNIMQRMSGIATQTALYVDKIADLPTKVIDTRKTTPNFRVFEKMAVRMGGGVNHRFGLFDMILVKDNHIDFAGGMSKALDNVRTYLKSHPYTLAVEVETRNLDDVNIILNCKDLNIHRIMFDNFTPELIREAVKLVSKRFETEASGGIEIERVRAYAEAGVDYISVGALTHQVRSLDLSLKAIARK